MSRKIYERVGLPSREMWDKVDQKAKPYLNRHTYIQKVLTEAWEREEKIKEEAFHANQVTAH